MRALPPILLAAAVTGAGALGGATLARMLVSPASGTMKRCLALRDSVRRRRLCRGGRCLPPRACRWGAWRGRHEAAVRRPCPFPMRLRRVLIALQGGVPGARWQHARAIASDPALHRRSGRARRRRHRRRAGRRFPIRAFRWSCTASGTFGGETRASLWAGVRAERSADASSTQDRNRHAAHRPCPPSRANSRRM